MRRKSPGPLLARFMLGVEAALCLLFAWLVLRVVPFRRLVWFFERPVRQPELTGKARAHARGEVRRAVNGVADRFPFPLVCFPRAVAAQAMLRHRRVQTVLYYGATTRPDTGLTAHVWVQDGPYGVVGHWQAIGFQVLARYPKVD